MRETFVVFVTGKQFYSKMLKKGFSHVFVLQRDNFNWVKIEPYNEHLDISILPCAANQMLPTKFFSEKGAVILRVQQDMVVKSFYSMGLHFVNCVSVVKYILGIKNKCITPYSLYKWLLKNEGEQGIISVETL